MRECANDTIDSFIVCSIIEVCMCVCVCMCVYACVCVCTVRVLYEHVWVGGWERGLECQTSECFAGVMNTHHHWVDQSCGYNDYHDYSIHRGITS